MADADAVGRRRTPSWSRSIMLGRWQEPPTSQLTTARRRDAPPRRLDAHHHRAPRRHGRADRGDHRRRRRAGPGGAWPFDRMPPGHATTRASPRRPTPAATRTPSFEHSPFIGRANPLVAADPPAGDRRHRARPGRSSARPTRARPGCVHGGYVAGAFDEVLGADPVAVGRARHDRHAHRQVPQPDAAAQPSCTSSAGSAAVEGRKIFTDGHALRRRPAVRRGRGHLHLDRLRPGSATLIDQRSEAEQRAPRPPTDRRRRLDRARRVVGRAPSGDGSGRRRSPRRRGAPAGPTRSRPRPGRRRGACGP